MFNRNAVLFAALAASFPVFAQSPAIQPAVQPAIQPAAMRPVAPPAQPGREASRIAEINERIAVMSAQLAELEMQAKISVKRAEIDKASMPDASRSFNTDEGFIPSVSEINGIDGRIWAVLNVQGGNTQTVRVGDRVGAWRVTEILPDSVAVKRGNETLRLSFGFNTPQPQEQFSGVAGQSGFPPAPSMSR